MRRYLAALHNPLYLLLTLHALLLFLAACVPAAKPTAAPIPSRPQFLYFYTDN